LAAAVRSACAYRFRLVRFYTGGFVGYGFSDVSVTTEDGFNNEDEFEFSYETDGFYAGSIIGYNLNFNAFVLGIEAELGHIDLEDESQDPRTNDPGEGIASVNTDFFGNISGRLGVGFDRFLVYGKGGFAFADVEVEFEDAFAADGSETLIEGTDEDEYLFGYTVGGGVEVGVGERWTVRGEYMYADLEEITQTVTSSDGGEFDVEHDLEDIHTVKLGVTRRF
jgi:outer membrane immunogenic protein